MAQEKNSDLFQDDLKGYLGIGPVISVDDEELQGRIKVRVFGKYDELDEELIPWCLPSNNFSGGSSTGGGMFSLPKVGSLVNVIFDNGDINCPIWTYNEKMSTELQEEIANSYATAHSLIYDTEVESGPVKVFFTEEKGMVIEYNASQVVIRPDQTVVIRFGESGKVLHVQEETISLGTEGASAQPAVLGDTLYDLLMEFIDELGKIAAFQSPAGPCSSLDTSPQWQLLVTNFKTKFEDFKSEIVNLD